MPVLLFGGPIWLLSLFIARRRSQLLRWLWQAVAAVFCLALAVQIACKLGLPTDSARYDGQQDVVATWLGDPGRSDVVLDVLAGGKADIQSIHGWAECCGPPRAIFPAVSSG